MPGEAGPEPTTVIGPRSDLMLSMRDLRSVPAGRRGGLTDSRRHSVGSCLPSKPASPPSATHPAERPALRERLALCFKELLESTFGGHLSSTSLFGSAQRTLSRIADSLTGVNESARGPAAESQPVPAAITRPHRVPAKYSMGHGDGEKGVHAGGFPGMEEISASNAHQ